MYDTGGSETLGYPGSVVQAYRINQKTRWVYGEGL